MISVTPVCEAYVLSEVPSVVRSASDLRTFKGKDFSLVYDSEVIFLK